MKAGDLVKTIGDNMDFPEGSLGVLVSQVPQPEGYDAWHILMTGTSKPESWVTMNSGTPTVEVV